MISARPLAFLGFLLFLASCAETELAVHTAKQLDEASQPKTQGYYKVGKPYQIDGRWYYPKEDFTYQETGVASWYGPGFHGKITANGEVYDQHDLTAAHRTLPMPSIVRVTNLENGRSIKVRINDRGPFAKDRIIDLSKKGSELLGFNTAGTAKVRVEILANESYQVALLAKNEDHESVEALPAVPTVSVSAQELSSVGTPVTADETVIETQSLGSQVAVRTQAQSSQTQSFTTSQPKAPSQPKAQNQAAAQVVGDSDIFVQAGSFTQVHNAERHRARLSGLGETQLMEKQVGGYRYYRVLLGPMASVAEADKMIRVLEANGIEDARIMVN